MTLENKLSSLKINGHVINVSDNGFYTCYDIIFDPGITFSKIKSRVKDLEIFFGAGVELETKQAGVITLKVKKATRKVIGIYDFTNDIANGVDGQKIPLIIGTTEDGKRYFYDLTKCPHILAGGSTGSGKSVFMHNLILSTFYTGNCNLMLIDVKRVEFSLYENIPHLLTPIIYDPKNAYLQLKNLCYEMEKRYKTFQDCGARNIEEYKNKGYKMNYYICFIDELADVMLKNPKIEDVIIHLAQLGRAAGIHLVTATQRPDASILSGLIRANIPTRACFAVQKATDSRIILDMAGGEKLRGAGDGLFLPIGSKNPVHFQAPFINTDTLEKLVNKVRHIND